MATYDPISLRRPIAELERWATEMVLWFQPQWLPLPVIMIQGNVLGRDVFDIAETLVHELTHLANFTAGIRDCSSNQYHNSHFRDRAVAVGLTCERIPLHGWAKTGLPPGLRERIANLHPDASAFDLFRLPPAPRSRVPVDSGAGIGIGASGIQNGGNVCVQSKKKKLAKWYCLGGCASAWVASGTELHAACLDCGSPFIRAEY